MPVRLPTTCYVHLATVHAHLHSEITGHCVPHYHPTETATGAHRMFTTSYSHIRCKSTSNLWVHLDSKCTTTSIYERWPMCSNNIADGAQYAHSVPNTYVHHIAHTTAHTPCATTVSVTRSSSNRVQTKTICILHFDIKQLQASSPYPNACNPHACNPLLLLTSQPTYLQQRNDTPTSASAQTGYSSRKTGGRQPC